MNICSISGDAILGIVGTILGTVLGWVLNSLSKKGGLQFYIKSWKENFYRKDEKDVCSHNCDIGEANSYSYNCFIEIFNSSGTQKIIRDIKIVFYKKNKELLSDVPQYDPTRSVPAPLTLYDNIIAYNIPSKQVVTIKLNNDWKIDKIDFYNSFDRVYLTYRNERNHIKKVLLKKKGGKDGNKK